MAIRIPRKPLPTDREIAARTWKRRRPAVLLLSCLVVVASLAVPPFSLLWHDARVAFHQATCQESLPITLQEIGEPRPNPRGTGQAIKVVYTDPSSPNARRGVIEFGGTRAAEAFAIGHSPGSVVKIYRSSRDHGLLWLSPEGIRDRGLGGAVMLLGFLTVGIGACVAWGSDRLRWGSGRDSDMHTHSGRSSDPGW